MRRTFFVRRNVVPIKVLYQTSAKAEGGREGRVSSPDGALDLELASPKELGGAGKAGSNPEQLFAAGYAACFMAAMSMVARRDKIHLPEGTTVTGMVGLGMSESHDYNLEVTLEANLPGMIDEQANELMEKTHHVCPYSSATRGNIDVKLSVVTAS